jgi:hypothetical protein
MAGGLQAKGSITMRALLAGIVVAVLLAIGIGYFFPLTPEPAWQAYSSSSVRVDDPGTNLVGPRWTGLNQVGNG